MVLYYGLLAFERAQNHHGDSSNRSPTTNRRKEIQSIRSTSNSVEKILSTCSTTNSWIYTKDLRKRLEDRSISCDDVDQSLNSFRFQSSCSNSKDNSSGIQSEILPRKIFSSIPPKSNFQNEFYSPNSSTRSIASKRQNFALIKHRTVEIGDERRRDYHQCRTNPSNDSTCSSTIEDKSDEKLRLNSSQRLKHLRKLFSRPSVSFQIKDRANQDEDKSTTRTFSIS